MRLGFRSLVVAAGLVCGASVAVAAECELSVAGAQSILPAWDTTRAGWTAGSALRLGLRSSGSKMNGACLGPAPWTRRRWTSFATSA